MLGRVIGALPAFALAAALAACASAPPSSDYRFELLDQQVRRSPNAEVRVRLVHLPDNRPVSGAVIYEHRFDMPMSGYKVATSRMVRGPNPPPIATVEEGNGVYRVHADVPMAGEWMMTLVARVPGEVQPVRGRVPMRVR